LEISFLQMVFLKRGSFSFAGDFKQYYWPMSCHPALAFVNDSANGGDSFSFVPRFLRPALVDRGDAYFGLRRVERLPLVGSLPGLEIYPRWEKRLDFR
jgi:hypothetical protein